MKTPKKEDLIKCNMMVMSHNGWDWCKRMAVIGGYCGQHDPVAISLRKKEKDHRYEAKLANRAREKKDIEHRLKFYEVFKKTLQEINEFGDHHLARMALNEDKE